MKNYLTFLSLALLLAQQATAVDFMTSILSEQKVVTQGAFNGLVIGASKADAIREIATLGVSLVVPIESITFLASYKDMSGLDNLSELRGIRISDNSARSVNFYLSNGKVDAIFRSVPSRDEFQGAEGISIQNLRERIVDALSLDHKLVAFPTIPPEDRRLISIKEAESEVKLLPYDAWSFEVLGDRPRGSLYRIYFKNEKLVKIEYSRERVGLD